MTDAQTPETSPGSHAPASPAGSTTTSAQDGVKVTTTTTTQPDGTTSTTTTTGPAAPASEAGADKQLIALCVVLWFVALAIAWSSFGETKVNYYLGNIKQTLDRESRLDEEAVSALAKMGDSVVSQLEQELSHHDDPMFRVAILKVLERIPGPAATKVIAETPRHDLDSRVRANAIQVLLVRGRQGSADDRERAVEAAREAVLHDAEPFARSIAARALGELKDPRGLPALVDALRAKEPIVRKSAHEALVILEPQGPRFEPEGADEVRVRQAWEWQNLARKKEGKEPLPEPPPPAKTPEPRPGDKPAEKPADAPPAAAPGKDKGLDQPVQPPAKK